MKISLNWTKDYVNLNGIKTEEIIDKLTMSGLEVEDYVNEFQKYSGIVVGLLKEVQKHPEISLQCVLCSTGNQISR